MKKSRKKICLENGTSKNGTSNGIRSKTELPEKNLGQVFRSKTERAYLYVPHIPYGKIRRQFIIDLYTENPTGMYAVNCKWRPSVKNDPDLQKLIKSGFLKVIRWHTHRSHAQTYLVKA